MGNASGGLEAEIWATVTQIPSGRCASYGDVGRALSTPISGFLVGRRLRHIPAGMELPWWRVVANTGALPVSKLDPYLGQEQEARLRQEGVPFTAERLVDLRACRHVFL